MTSERVAAPGQLPTIAALDHGEDASTWSGCQRSRARWTAAASAKKR